MKWHSYDPDDIIDDDPHGPGGPGGPPIYIRSGSVWSGRRPWRSS